MILPFIEVSIDINSGQNEISSIPDKNEVVEDEIIPEYNSDSNSPQVQKHDEDSFEMKYKALMNKIEKERFERELLAGSR